MNKTFSARQKAVSLILAATSLFAGIGLFAKEHKSNPLPVKKKININLNQDMPGPRVPEMVTLYVTKDEGIKETLVIPKAVREGISNPPVWVDYSDNTGKQLSFPQHASVKSISGDTIFATEVPTEFAEQVDLIELTSYGKSESQLNGKVTIKMRNEEGEFDPHPLKR